MPKKIYLLILVSLIGAAQAGAADAPAKKQKDGNKVERAVENTGKALGKTADKVEKKVRKGATATGNAIDTAGKKTGRWIKEKVD